MVATPRTEVEIPDPETGETVTREVMVHVECKECGHSRPLELAAGHLTDPCPECSAPADASTRTPAELSLSIRADTLVNSGKPDTDAGGIDPYLETATKWIRRLDHLTTGKSWHLNSVEKANNQTTFHLRRPIVDDDGIDYDTLRGWEEEYNKELDQLKPE